ncbi:MAG TPA: dihydrodipicolinate synthase family protein [Acidimicrobiia bacterium]|nr:dihydrodipicolinate synthase family protein [Acidimicrobiia bacterium]
MRPLPEYLPALITPFTQRGEIDIKAHTHNMRVLADRGIEGFVIGGSNGEGPYLEPGERERLVKAGRRRKAHFMVGIAAESTRVALAQVAEATEGGADTLLVLTPTTLSRGRDDAVVDFYRAIADTAKVPVLLYSVPNVTGYSLPIELVARLSRYENIIGMKDSSGDVVRLQSIIDATPGEFVLFSGASKALTAAIAVGCYGAITGSGNYAPGLVLKTMKEARESPASARRSQKRLSRLSADVEAHGIPGVKAAARAGGLEPGYPRAPLTRLTKGVETSIAKLIT